jgi:hypothetical protein
MFGGSGIHIHSAYRVALERGGRIGRFGGHWRRDYEETAKISSEAKARIILERTATAKIRALPQKYGRKQKAVTGPDEKNATPSLGGAN